MVCVIKVDIGASNGLLIVYCQVIIWTNANLMSSGPVETNINEF